MSLSEVPVDPAGSARGPSRLAAFGQPACRLGADGRVLEQNEACRALTGWTVSSPDSDPPLWQRLELPEDDGLTRELRAAIAEQRFFAGEVAGRAAGGRTCWFDLVITPRADTGDLIAVLRDVTARRTAHEVLGLAPSGDRLLLDRIPSGIVVHGADTQILYANAKAIEMLGITYDAALGEMVTSPHWRFLAEDGSPMAIADFPLSRALTTRTVARDVLVGIRRPSDDAERWALCEAYPLLAEDGSIREVVVSFADVTALKLVERALLESRERLDLALRGSRDAHWDWDIRRDTAYFSPRWFEMLGLPVDTGRRDFALWTEQVHPDDRSRVTSLLERALADPAQDSLEMEYRLHHSEGREQQVLTRALIVRDTDGGAIRMSGTNADVTERRELEERLRQSQKMEAIGQLAGGIAHDFNNILGVILGNLELVASAVPRVSEAADGLRDALVATRRGADLTRRLLAFSRRQVLSPQVVALHQVVDELALVARRLLGGTIMVAIDVSPDLPPVFVDPGLLENALLNIAINARDAMPRGGTLRFSARTERIVEEPPGATGVLPRGDYVRLDVSDTGVGMPPDVLARALDPFFTTKPTGQGTGLGLSMAYGFAKQSGGTLTLTSEPGVGTCVSLLLPTSEVSARSATPAPHAAPEIVADPEMVVLLVEDDDAIRRLVARTLRRMRYRVVEAADGPQALAELRNLPRVDLLLTDLMMPGGMSGIDVADAVREARPDARMLFMSGYPAGMLRDDRPDAAQRMLHKPFTMAQLQAAIVEVMQPVD